MVSNQMITDLAFAIEQDCYEIDHDEVFLDMAMERSFLDVPIHGEDKVDQKMATADRIHAQIVKLTKSLQGIINKVSIQIRNAIQRVIRSDKKFQSQYASWSQNQTPNESVTLISYNYKPEALELDFQKMLNATLSICNELKKASATISRGDVDAMDGHNGNVFQLIFEKMGERDVSNIEQYFTVLRDRFRNEKKEMTYYAGNMNRYYSIATGLQNTDRKIEAAKQRIEQATSQSITDMNRIAHDPQMTDQLKRKALHQYKNLTHVVSFYMRYCDLYLQLKIEEAMIYRRVIQSLYQGSDTNKEESKEK